MKRYLLAGVLGVCLFPSAALANRGLWISDAEIAALPTSGSGWANLKKTADQSTGTPDLSNQDDPTNVRVLAKALVYAKTKQQSYRNAVVSALTSIANSGKYSGRALSLGREIGAYVLAADLVDYSDAKFRDKLRELRTTSTSEGPKSLIECHEKRPNNWGNHCGASRLAISLYLGDTTDVARAAQVFRGYLGDRAAYAGFKYGALDWQADSSTPVGINPAGATKHGHSIDGVLPDDQRRAGSFEWPPPEENYVYEGLQGALVQAVLLSRAGYDVWDWEDQALLRAFAWLHDEAEFRATGDDTWEPHVINHFYNTTFPAPVPSRPGKNVGWTDWTLKN